MLVPVRKLTQNHDQLEIVAAVNLGLKLIAVDKFHVALGVGTARAEIYGISPSGAPQFFPAAGGNAGKPTSEPVPHLRRVGMSGYLAHRFPENSEADVHGFGGGIGQHLHLIFVCRDFNNGRALDDDADPALRVPDGGRRSFFRHALASCDRPSPAAVGSTVTFTKTRLRYPNFVKRTGSAGGHRLFRCIGTFAMEG